jgi:chromate transporter
VEKGSLVVAKGPSLWEIFLLFFKIGMFTIGGGYVMVPVMQKEITEKRDWMSKEDFSDMLGITQAAPGPIAINTATYVGYTLKKKAGAAAAILGCAIPSLLVITLIAAVFPTFMKYEAFQSAFRAVRPAVVALIAAAVITLSKTCIKKPVHLLIATIAFVLNFVLQVSPFPIIAGCAALALLLPEGVL